MLFLKQYFPIFNCDSLLCIGIPGTNCYVEKENTEKDGEKQVRKLISEGVNIIDIKKEKLYYELFNKNMLVEFEEYQKNLNNRNRLFSQYMELPQISKENLKSKILIFGAGAAGATIALLLLQFSFENIIVIDDDIVEQSDIRKTLVFRKEHLNRKKVECISEIAEENYCIEIQTLSIRPTSKNDILKIINNYKPDIIVKACDPDLSFRLFLNDICFKKGIPFIHMSYSFERINLGPFFIPGKTSCDNYTNEFIKRNNGEKHDFLKHRKLFTSYTIHPSTPFIINMLSNYAFIDLLFYFLGKFELIKSLGKIVYLYPLTMHSFSRKLQCDKSCYCQTLLKK